MLDIKVKMYRINLYDIYYKNGRYFRQNIQNYIVEYTEQNGRLYRIKCKILKVEYTE